MIQKENTIQNYELFSIQIDKSVEYTAEKVTMNQKGCQEFFSLFEKFEEVEVTGLYGSYYEILKTLKMNFEGRSLSSCQVEHGKLFGLNNNNQMIFFLTFPDNFFVSKPMDEKSIKITLFRIMFDLVKNIQLCFDKEVFNQWYDGEFIPFSDVNIMKRQEYIIDSSQNKKIIEKSLYLDIFGRQQDQQLKFIYQNKGCWAVFTSVQEYSENEIKQEFQKQYESTMQEMKKKVKQNQEISIDNEVQNYFLFYTNSQKSSDRDSNFQKEGDLHKSLSEFINDYKTKGNDNKREKCIESFQKKLSEQLVLQDKVIFKVQRCTFKCIRQSDSLDDQVSNVRLEIENNCFIQRLEFTKYQKGFWEKMSFRQEKAIPKFEFSFRTTEDHEVFLFFDSILQQHLVYMLPQSQKNWIQLLSIQNTNDSCVFYYNEKNNSLYVFNAQKNKVVFKFEFQGKNFSGFMFCEQFLKIQQVAFLQLTKKFIILTQDKQFLVLGETDRTFQTQNLYNEKNCQIHNFQYNQLLTCPSGKYFYLTDHSKCYMFDCNFAIVRCFQIQGAGQKLTVFSDKSDVFILNYQFKQIIVLTNVIDKSSLTKVKNEENKIVGNPSIDIIKGASIKFGPVSLFLTNEKQNKVWLYVNEDEQVDKVQSYLNQLNLSEFEVRSNTNLVFSSVNLMQLKGNFYSRVPLQLCTIENANLVPLIDGFRKDMKKNKFVTIEEKTKQLHLGHLENYFINLKEKIFVVSVIGKQSSGKSYLLNRIFGTRYSVAACRCTDGVWASFARVENQNYLIFDCEGLFSSVRSQKEEVQMLAFLTALSDVTLLNQDLTFNRFLADLLDKLSEASEQLAGDTLFKGILTIVLRDVSYNDNSGVDEELINNINKSKSEESQEVVYLKKLFNNKFFVEKLLNYENRKFDNQIITLRRRFIEQSNNCRRWENGEQLIQQMKILLCQLETSDKTDSTLLQQQMKIRQIISEKKQEWMQFILNLNKSAEIQKLNLEGEDCDKELQLEDFSNPKIRNLLNQQFREMVQNKLGLVLKTKQHNENLKRIDDEIQIIFKEKSKQLLIQIDELFLQLNKAKEIQECQVSEKAQFSEFLQKQILQYKFCMQKCSMCSLNCQNFSIHDSESKIQLNELKEKISNLEKIIESDKQFEKQNITNEILSQQQEQSDNLQNQIKEFQQQLKQLELSMQLFQENENLTIITQKKRKYYDDHLSQLEKFLIQLPENLDEQDKISIEEANLKQLNQAKSNMLAERAEIEIQISKLQQEQNKTKKQDQVFDVEEQEILNQEQSLNTVIKKSQQQIDNLQQAIIQKENLLSENGARQLIQIEQFENMAQIESDFVNINLQIEENDASKKLWQAQSEKLLIADQFFELFEKKNSSLEQISQQIDELKLKKNTLEGQGRKLSKQSKEYKQLKEQILEIDKIIQQLDDQYEEERSPQIDLIQELQGKEGISNQEIYNGFLQINADKEKEFQNKGQELLENQQKLQKIINEYKKQQENMEEQKIIENQKSRLQQDQESLIKITQDLKNLQQQLENKRLEKEKIKNQLQNQQDGIQVLFQSLENLKMMLQSLDVGIEKYPQYINLTKEHEEIQKRQNNLKDMLIDFMEEEEPQTAETCTNTEQFQTKIEKLQKEILIRQTENNELQNTILVFRKIQEQHLELTSLKNQVQKIEKNKDDHSCLRINHQCDEFCICCEGAPCKFPAGHTGEHLCTKPDHSCDEQCQVDECLNKCSFVRNHPNQHICQSFHACTQICQHCTKQCEIDCQQKHDEHFCKEPKCIRKCFLCDSTCNQKHSHSKQPEQQHFCNKEQHTCQQLCQKQGICKIIYEQITSEWKTELSTFMYTYYKQIDAGKQHCILSISKDQTNHKMEHLCFEDTEKQFHQCKQRCPECDAFCTKTFNHSDVHSTHQHRNKEKQYFTLTVGRAQNIYIDGAKAYKIGDSAKPETCWDSCKRRGRSHFHLMECQGGLKCLEKNAEYQKYARHSKQKYQGFETLNFDEVLCCHFWKIQKWSHPNSITQQEDIAKCDHYCSQCGDQDKKFCVEMAWHSNSNKRADHKFICQEFHLKNQLKGLQICFVIDSTGSMASYLQQSIDVINQIMVKSKDYKIDGKIIPVEFSIVSYKDHPVPYNSTQVVEIRDFTNDSVCSSFLKGITAGGGGDTPEAVLDGLQAALKLKWNFDYQRILYLIADAPPHGKNKGATVVYHNSDDSYPNGCPCGLKQQPILYEMKKMNIKFKILKVNDFLELTIAEFKKDYNELELLDIRNNLASFVDVVVEDACSVMKQDEITYAKRI